jgi:hypothetical protein
MRNVGVLAIVLGIIGLVIGYLVFGRIFGNLVPIADIFRPASGALAELGQSLTGIREMRQNILISGGVGVVAGFVLGLFLRRR